MSRCGLGGRMPSGRSPKQSEDAAWVAENNAPADARVVRLEAEVERLRKLLGLVRSYGSTLSPEPHWMAPRKRPPKMAATAVLQLSDLHLDEVVDPAQVGGLGAYNREIAEMRLRRWA